MAFRGAFSAAAFFVFRAKNIGALPVKSCDVGEQWRGTMVVSSLPT